MSYMIIREGLAFYNKSINNNNLKDKLNEILPDKIKNLYRLQQDEDNDYFIIYKNNFHKNLLIPYYDYYPSKNTYLFIYYLQNSFYDNDEINIILKKNSIKKLKNKICKQYSFLKKLPYKYFYQIFTNAVDPPSIWKKGD